MSDDTKPPEGHLTSYEIALVAEALNAFKYHHHFEIASTSERTWRGNVVRQQYKHVLQLHQRFQDLTSTNKEDQP